MFRWFDAAGFFVVICKNICCFYIESTYQAFAETLQQEMSVYERITQRGVNDEESGSLSWDAGDLSLYTFYERTGSLGSSNLYNVYAYAEWHNWESMPT